ncbi:MAG TPA: tetratricopeptide repeat protein [Anaerolineae bacterium]|nr:tetratricopeptide repeat protein [Anaerolineae bacterium]
MTKHKRRHTPQGRRAQRPAALKQEGAREFKSGHYHQAIALWDEVSKTAADLVPKEALAEALFRHSLEGLRIQGPNFNAIIADLRRALTLKPDDPIYTYHLGLAAHRQGDLQTALEAYQKVRQCDKVLAARAAYPLALLLLQLGKDPTADPVWAALPVAQQKLLQAAAAFRRRPYLPAEDAPALWRALAALDRGECDTAHALLRSLADAPESHEDAGLAHYYLGVLAAQDEAWHEARREWTKAVLKKARAAALSANLSELYHRLAEEHLIAGNLVGALDAAQEAERRCPDDARLQRLLSHIYQSQGYQAAIAAQWPAALEHWTKAYHLEEGSFRLAYNLALTHEKMENFFEAAELWREALRRRPRRSDHADAISDEQVAKLWRRTAEAYLRAGEYNEAINVYKLAVKWHPEDLNTRMALVEGLIDNGQLQAARNELERVLAQNGDYIPALLRMGEILAHTEYWWYASGAETYYTRVLKLEPDNAAARKGIADMYIQRGDEYFRWQGPQVALPYYQKALEFQPQSGLVNALLGGCFMALKQPDLAEPYLDAALDYGRGNMEIYNELLHIWLSYDNEAKAWEVMAQAEATIPNIPIQTYLIPAIYCLQMGRFDLARSWLEHVVTHAQPEEQPLFMVGQLLSLTPALDLAAEYLERAIAAGQQTGLAYTTLALIAARQQDTPQAKKYLAQAEKLQRQTHDPELRQQIDSVRSLITMPPDMLNMMINNPSLLGGGPFGNGGPFPNMFGGGMDYLDDYDDEFDDEFDDEEYDDDEDLFGIFGI